MYNIINADVLEWARNYDGPKFYALLCDPPYHLTSPVSNSGSQPTEGVHGRIGRIQSGKSGNKRGGFMGKKWDGGDIAFRPETWALLAEHLYPGAFLIAFSGSRGWHRQAVAMEDAGLIMHPTIFGWNYGCLSSDTEILTDSGWKCYLDISIGSKVMCYNVTKETLDYAPVEETYEYDYNDTAYRIHSDNTDQLVSRNHRCLVERGGKFVFRRAETLERQEGVPVLESMSDLPKNIHGRQYGRILQKEPLYPTLRHGIISEKKTRLNVRAQTEQDQETYVGAQGNSDNLCGVPEKSIQTERMDTQGKISNLFQKLQRETERQGVRQAWVQGAGGVDAGERKKFQPKDVGRKQSRLERWGNLFSQARQLCTDKIRSLSAGILGYGTQRWLYYGTSPNSGATHGAIVVENGGGSSRRPQPAEQRAKEPDVICKQFGTQELRALRFPVTDLATVTPIHYGGKVWCVKVPTGAFVARRNGKVFITGNSGFPKATRVKDSPTFDGHRYGLQALKPALEPILVFQVPYSGRPVDNITSTGAGALNIDGARIGVDWNKERGETWLNSGKQATQDDSWQGPTLKRNGSTVADRVSNLGRWPANFLIQHSESCKVVGQKQGDGYTINRFTDGAKPFGGGAGHEYETSNMGGGVEDVWECSGECPVRRLNEQSGELTSGKPGIRQKSLDSNIFGGGNGLGFEPNGETEVGIGDSGGASRFFYNSNWNAEVEERLENSDPVRYQAKAGRQERDAGLEDIPFTVSGMSNGAQINGEGYDKGQDIGLNRVISPRNHHPTVKPITLCKWLATLLLPPDLYSPRRLLVPFSGTSSEMIGAIQAGWEEVTGIEAEAEYVPIANARLKYWSDKMTISSLPLFGG